VPSVQTLQVGDAHGSGHPLPSGVQTPAGSENLLAQAVALATASWAKQKESDEVKIEPLSVPSLFGDCMIQTSRRVASATTRSDDAYVWFLAVKKPGTTFEQFADSGAFSSLDGKLFTALEGKIKPPLSLKVQLKQRELAASHVLMKGGNSSG
jgi:hypothetical protein